MPSRNIFPKLRWSHQHRFLPLFLYFGILYLVFCILPYGESWVMPMKYVLLRSCRKQVVSFHYVLFAGIDQKTPQKREVPCCSETNPLQSPLKASIRTPVLSRYGYKHRLQLCLQIIISVDILRVHYNNLPLLYMR